MTQFMVFQISELLDAILTHIIDIPTKIKESELRSNDEAPSAIAAIQTLLSLAQVDRWFYHAIIHNGQHFFLCAVRNFSWMLPLTPADWVHSKLPADLTPELLFSRQTHIDWRSYIITCLRRATPHLRNRWRFNRMALQFARGKVSKADPSWFWKAGKLGLTFRLEKPEPEAWELPPAE
ncbi:hypothetical protein B7463_g584, partial [Scytalidium lignicola]